MPEKPSPNAAETANRPTSFCVSRKATVATAWQADPAITAPTVIYAPRIQFPDGVSVTLEEGDAEVAVQPDAQRILVTARRPGRVAVRVSRR